MSSRAVAAAMAAAVLLAGCGGGSGSEPGSGVRGQVTAGPVCPVQAPGADCSPRPLQAQMTITPVSGGSTVSVSSDAQGSYSAALPPGDYTVQGSGPTPPTLAPVTFTVRPGSYTHLDLIFDSGIR